MSADLAFMNAIELGAAIRSGEVSSVEATENFFQRIERLDPQLNSYLALCQDQALADARPPTRRCVGATPPASSTASPYPSKTWK